MKRSHWRSLTMSTVVAGVLAASFSLWVPGVTWIPLVCVLGGIALLITQRTTGDSVLTWVVCASFGIRVVLAVMLFATSSLHLPILQSSQVDHGLWAFGVDGVFYHDQALRILDAWRTGSGLPAVIPELLLPSLLMAVVYTATGISALHFILVNAWLGAMSGLLAYLLGARLGDRRSALAAAVLVGFWPSSILWSTQLLKDPAVIVLILAVLLLIVTSWQHYSRPRVVPDGPAWMNTARWGALAASAFGLACFRHHVAFTIAVSASVVLAIALVRALLKGRWTEAIAALGIIAVVGTGTWTGVSLDLATALSPFNPEVRYVRQGDILSDQHDVQSAIASYRRAIDLNANYPPAYFRLGQILINQGDRAGAVAAFNTYLSLEPDKTRREAIRLLLERPPVASVPAIAGTDVETVPEPSSGWSQRLVRRLSQSVASVAKMRRVAVEHMGGSLVDDTTFDGVRGLLAYLPRALVIAYLAPFPWQLMSAGGQTGVMRSVASAEIVLIALLVPAMAVGCWRKVTRFRAEEWVVMVFIAGMALGYGMMVPNGGTLFRGRLQFLLPTVILASSALPAFAYRLLGSQVLLAKPRDNDSDPYAEYADC